MRVATITFSYSQNIGAMLQTYALQRYIQSLGHSCEIIKYKEYDTRSFETIKGIPDALSDVFCYFDCKEKIKKINNFRQTYFSTTAKTYTTDDELAQLNSQFDAFVAGSDQIWNVHKGIIHPFFLTFVDDRKKKMSYAASFGLSQIPEQYKDEVRKYLLRLDAVSVRESTGVKIVEELIHQKPVQSIDPVFLLPRSHWDEMCSDIGMEDFIFVYPTQITKELKQTVKRAKKELGCKVYSLFYFPGVDKVVKNADPLDFLAYIKNAKLIVASSFHATAFALIFEKNLRVIPHKSTGSRVIDLLNDVGLHECITENSDSVNFSPTDYTKARKILSEKIELSKKYLKESFL